MRKALPQKGGVLLPFERRNETRNPKEFERRQKISGGFALDTCSLGQPVFLSVIRYRSQLACASSTPARQSIRRQVQRNGRARR